LFFFNQYVFPSRLIILFTWLLAIVLVSAGRIILRAIQVRAMRRGIGLHRLVVISPSEPLNLVSEIKNRKELGYKIVSELPSNLTTEQFITELDSIRQKFGIDELMQAD